MSKLKKEMKELVELAKYSKEESIFQQKHQYKKFKAKYNYANEIVTFFIPFVFDLTNCKFFEESIYWSKRVIEDVRLCDKEIRLNALLFIARSYHCLNQLNNALEYGKKYLKADMQPITSNGRGNKKEVLIIMCSVSLQLLKNQDTVKY
jgi:formyltetrahydrofolate hydrolase